MENIVIGIEGTVGAGKTSICRELLKDIENSIILHGGEIYRAIVYGMMQNQIENAQNLDAFDIMKKLGIEIKLENKERVIYMNGKKVDEKDLQSKKSSMAVSKVSNTADNTRLYQFGKELIDKYRQKYNVILSSRDIVKMYPDVTYHFFIDASIQVRDALQEKSGYYKIYPQTKIIDVTNCKSAKESEKLVLENMKEAIKIGI